MLVPLIKFCKVGQYESSINEIADDDEDISRIPSPEPQNPPPDKNNFLKLTVHEQLSYVKPILAEILSGRYEPAKERHEGYIKGGAARANTENSAAARGVVSPGDVNRLQKYILRWALGEVGLGGVKENIYRSLEVEAEAQASGLPSLCVEGYIDGGLGFRMLFLFLLRHPQNLRRRLTLLKRPK